MSKLPTESKWAKSKNDPTLEQFLLRGARKEINEIIGRFFYNGIDPTHLIILLFNTVISFSLTIAKHDKQEDILKTLEKMFHEVLETSKQSLPALSMLHKMAEGYTGEAGEEATQKIIDVLKAAGVLDVGGEDNGSKS